MLRIEKTSEKVKIQVYWIVPPSVSIYVKGDVKDTT